MSTAAGIHAALITAIDAVTGCRPATTPWTLDAFPATLHNGGFLLIPTVEEPGAEVCGGDALDTLRYRLLFPWRLTLGPSTAAQACMTKVAAVRTALKAAVVSDARVRVEAVSYETSDDGQVLLATVDLAATALIDL